MSPVKLFQFLGGHGVSSYSPFCLKLETFFLMAGVPYEIEYTFDVKKSPTRKFPYILHDERFISDSGFIIDYIKMAFGVDPDHFLNTRECAEALAWSRLMEEHAYWVLLYSRWLDHRNDAAIREVYFRDFPRIVKSPLLFGLRRRIRRDLYGQGLGRHSEAELYDLGCRDLSALSSFLGNAPYFFGDQASSLDAVAYAFLANLRYVPFASPLRDHVHKLENLVAYCDRMQDRFYPQAG